MPHAEESLGIVYGVEDAGHVHTPIGAQAREVLGYVPEPLFATTGSHDELHNGVKKDDNQNKDPKSHL